MQKELFRKFHELPLNLKNLLFSRESVEYIEELEYDYNIALTEILMKIVVGDIALRDLGKMLMREQNMNIGDAATVSQKLINRIFSQQIDFFMNKKSRVEIPAAQNKNILSSSRPLLKSGAQNIPKPPAPTPKQNLVSAKPVRVPSLYAPLRDMPNTLTPGSQTKKITKPWTGKEASPIIPNTKDIQNLLGAEHKHSAGDAFIRAPQEAEEKSKFNKNISDMNTEEFIEELIRMFTLPVPNEDAKKRFTTIMYSYIKGIRDDYELKEKLMAPWKMGGMDFSSGMVENIQKISHEKALHASAVPKSPEEFGEEKNIITTQVPRKEISPIAPKPPAPMPSVRRLSYTIDAPQQPRGGATIPTNNPVPLNPIVQGWAPHQTQMKPLQQTPRVKPRPVPAHLPVQDDGSAERQVKGPQVLGGPVAPAPARTEQVKKPITPPPFTPPRLRPQLSSGKTAIMDIKAPVSPTGPIEELKAFTVKDLRQLSPRPEQVMEILKGKFDLLMEDSYDRLSLGIKAWKQSPLHQLYIELGHESLEQGKPVEVIMETRKSEGESYLTPEEFYAIADLNRKLRF